MRRAMGIDFADLLMEVVSRRASDLHLSAGAHPTVRVRGRLTPLEEYPVLSGTDTREIVYSILNGDQRQRLETDWQLDFAYSVPGSRALPRQRLLPARRDRRGVPPDPLRPDLDRRARPAADGARVHAQAARLRARDRPDRLGQVHLAGGDDRRDQPDARRAHHDDRGPDRVPAPAQALPDQPARAGLGRAQLRRRPEGRPAPGPRRDPGRRDARPGDDLHGADRGRDRPPRVRDPAHPGHRRRRSTA